MPRPTHRPMIPSSGMDDENPADVMPTTIAQAPAIDAPTVPAPAPTAPDLAAIMAQMKAMQQAMANQAETIARLSAAPPAAAAPGLAPDDYAELLALRLEKARNAPAPEVEAAKVAPSYKLYFIGQRRVEAHQNVPAHFVADLYPNRVTHVLEHTCGRLSLPVTFGPSRDDQRPHAYVTKGEGDWLIANDCAFSFYGDQAEVRYEWAPEAKAAFEPDRALVAA